MMKARLHLLAAATLCACSAPIATYDCKSAGDCDEGFCVSGSCVSTTAVARIADAGQLFSSADGALVPLDDKGDGSLPTYRVPCSGALPASADSVALNEILVNVPTGPEGDANGDGVRDAYEDEFVELANVSDGPIDMKGVAIYSNGKLKFMFEPWCLLAGEAVVVFGGGSVGLSVTSKAAISDTRFAFANDGGLVTISTEQGEIARVEYGRSAPASLTRAPQLVGREWVPHTSLSARPFSPGACPDGAPMPSGCATANPATTDAGADASDVDPETGPVDQ